jgi:AraC-like DNA-binding protein
LGAFVRIARGHERRAAGSAAPRHRHDQAYAAVVLAGGYEESGSGGRYRVGPGDVLFHDAFDAHLDRFGATGAEIFNLPLTARPVLRAGHVHDPDELMRLAAQDCEAALHYLVKCVVQTGPLAADWPDLLAADLLEDRELRLDAWARHHGLATETLSRGFGKLYGVTPAAFRAEARARRAFDAVAQSDAPLADIAVRTGHADQPHMTRAVKALTGAAPGHWRARSNPFKTAPAQAA